MRNFAEGNVHYSLTTSPGTVVVAEGVAFAEHGSVEVGVELAPLCKPDAKAREAFSEYLCQVIAEVIPSHGGRLIVERVPGPGPSAVRHRLFVTLRVRPGKSARASHGERNRAKLTRVAQRYQARLVDALCDAGFDARAMTDVDCAGLIERFPKPQAGATLLRGGAVKDGDRFISTLTVRVGSEGTRPGMTDSLFALLPDQAYYILDFGRASGSTAQRSAALADELDAGASVCYGLSIVVFGQDADELRRAQAAVGRGVFRMNGALAEVDRPRAALDNLSVLRPLGGRTNRVMHPAFACNVADLFPYGLSA